MYVYFDLLYYLLDSFIILFSKKLRRLFGEELFEVIFAEKKSNFFQSTNFVAI